MTLGQSTTTLGLTLKIAMFEAARDTVFAGDANTMASFGHPGPQRPTDFAFFGAFEAQQVDGPFSAAERIRDETIQVVVTFSVFRGGGPDAEQAAYERADEMLGQFEYYCRQTNTTMGGLVWRAVLDHYQADGWTVVEGDVAVGRNATIEATFVAQCQVRGTNP